MRSMTYTVFLQFHYCRGEREFSTLDLLFDVTGKYSE